MLALTLTMATIALTLAGPAQAQGTVEASFDGESRTWYSVAGDARDGPYASSVWTDGPDGAVVVIGGLDDENPPIETFSRGDGPGVGEPSLGDYSGSALTVALQLRADPVGEYVLDGTSASQVIYAGDASDLSPEAMYSMAAGTLTIESFVQSDGGARVRGTFSGRLEPLAGGGSAIELTGGRFDVRDIPSVDDLLGGG